MFKQSMIIIGLFSLTACALIPKNNDKIIPKDTPESKVITIIQQDQVIRSSPLNKDFVTTNLTIDGEDVQRYFKRKTVARRYPAPKSIIITCRHSSGINYVVTRWNTHLFNEKLEEGKTYTFMCEGLDSYKVTVGDFSQLMQ